MVKLTSTLEYTPEAMKAEGLVMCRWSLDHDDMPVIVAKAPSGAWHQMEKWWLVDQIMYADMLTRERTVVDTFKSHTITNDKDLEAPRIRG